MLAGDVVEGKTENTNHGSYECRIPALELVSDAKLVIECIKTISGQYRSRASGRQQPKFPESSVISYKHKPSFIRFTYRRKDDGPVVPCVPTHCEACTIIVHEILAYRP